MTATAPKAERRQRKTDGGEPPALAERRSGGEERAQRHPREPEYAGCLGVNRIARLELFLHLETCNFENHRADSRGFGDDGPRCRRCDGKEKATEMHGPPE
jgi:hypothetical protein